jgi:hypothetical protein
MPGKKFASGKKSSASVLKMKLVVAWSAPQKLYCLSPIPDHKRRGFGGLLSLLVVHAKERDEKASRAAESTQTRRPG